MALESIITPKRAEGAPWKMFFVGVLYSTFAVFLSIWIFKAYASIIMVLLTVIASVPLMYSTMKSQEKIVVKFKDEKAILKRHGEVLKYLLFLFGGFVVSYSFWFIVLPSTTVQFLFSSQIETISAINSKIVGEAISSSAIFLQIFLNNFKVLLFAIFFAFFYGAGAIFILTWNASVISAALGGFVKDKLAVYAASIGATGVFQYFQSYSLGFLRYSIHGIPEIAAYFIGGLAGSIISFAVINRDLEGSHYKKIMVDVIQLTLIAIAVLIIAALLEVYVTPIFF